MMPSSGKRFFQRCDRARHEPLGIESFAAIDGLEALLDHGERAERRMRSFRHCSGDLQAALSTGHALHARHGSHFLSTVFTVEDEDRIDEIVRRQHVLAHQAARKIVAPHASHAHRRERAVNLHR
jgi:hypothetical protein